MPVGLAGRAAALRVGLAVVPALPGRRAARVGRAALRRGRDARATAIAHLQGRIVPVARVRAQARAAGRAGGRVVAVAGAVAGAVVEAGRARRIDVAVESADGLLSVGNKNAGTRRVAPRAGAGARGVAADSGKAWADPRGAAVATLAVAGAIARLAQPPRLTSIGPLHRRIDRAAGIERYRSRISGERARAATARDRRDHRQRHHAVAYPGALHRHDHDARPSPRCQPAARGGLASVALPRLEWTARCQSRV